MSGQQVPVTIQILDKEYMVSCPEEERSALIESAKYLHSRMRETREGGKVIGTERIAVMAALNIIHELLQSQREKERFEEDVGARVQRIHEKIDSAFGRRPREEALD